MEFLSSIWYWIAFAGVAAIYIAFRLGSRISHQENAIQYASFEERLAYGEQAPSWSVTLMLVSAFLGVILLLVAFLVGAPLFLTPATSLLKGGK